MRNSSKALLAGAIALSAGTARATPSRVAGLGDMGRYVEDDSNVLTYPGLIGVGKSSMLSSYTHFVYVDLGGPAGISPIKSLSETQEGLNGGAFLRLSDGLNLGLVASSFASTEEKDFLSQIDGLAAAPNQGQFAKLAPSGALRRYDLILGYTASKELGLGARLSYGSASETYTPDSSDKQADGKTDRQPDTKSQKQIRIGLGASGMLDAASGYDVEAHYAYHGLGYVANGDEPFLGGGANGFGLSARYRMQMTKWWDLIPQVAYEGVFFQQLTEDRTVPSFGEVNAPKPEKLPGGEKHFYDRTHSSLDVGVAAAMRAAKQATFWVATGIQYQSIYAGSQIKADGGRNDISDLNASLYSLPYLKFAFEAAPLDWLRLRASAEKYTWSGSTSQYKKSSEGKTETTREVSGACTANSAACGMGAAPVGAPPDFAANLGASFLLNGFSLDVVLDKNLITNGPNFLTGGQSTLAARASVGAKF